MRTNGSPLATIATSRDRSSGVVGASKDTAVIVEACILRERKVNSGKESDEIGNTY